jgi:hypothetical protein
MKADFGRTVAQGFLMHDKGNGTAHEIELELVQ